MAVLKALRQVPDALVRNPVLFGVLAVFGLLQAPQLLAQTIDPLFASVVSLIVSVVMLFVIPFVQAGLVGMADEALDGRTRVGTFLRAGREHYLSVLGAYFAVVALSFALGIVAFVGAVFGGTLAFAGEGAQVIGLVVIGGVLLLVAVAYFVVAFFVQFYSQVIVLDGASAVEGLKGSARLVRRNLLSTAGYTLLVVVVAGLVGVLGGVISLVVGPAAPGPGAGEPPGMGATLSLTDATVLLGLYVAGSAIAGGILLVYSVAFYRELRDRTAGVLAA